MFEKLVEHEGELESKTYSIAYKLGIDNSDPNCTVVMLAFQLGYNIEKFPENVMLAKVFRRFADEIEGSKLTPVNGGPAEQQSLPFTYEEDEEEHNAPKTIQRDQRFRFSPSTRSWGGLSATKLQKR